MTKQDVTRRYLWFSVGLGAVVTVSTLVFSAKITATTIAAIAFVVICAIFLIISYYKKSASN